MAGRPGDAREPPCARNKLALLLGGSLATELLFAVALGVFANAFGYDVSLADLLLINISRLAARELRPGARAGSA